MLFNQNYALRTPSLRAQAPVILEYLPLSFLSVAKNLGRSSTFYPYFAKFYAFLLQNTPFYTTLPHFLCHCERQRGNLYCFFAVFRHYLPLYSSNSRHCEHQHGNLNQIFPFLSPNLRFYGAYEYKRVNYQTQ